MPAYKNRFSALNYVEESILDQGGEAIGTRRVKPSSISWSSFLSFRHEKEHEKRYSHGRGVQEFFTFLMVTAHERVEAIPKGQRYWRAQLHSDGDEIVDDHLVPYPPERMKPVPEKASDGRVSPQGIPVLYLSTDEQTAISEVRPWVGSYVTAVQFETRRDLRLVDCSGCEIDPMYKTVWDLDKLFKLKPPETEEATRVVWRWIDLAFSEPVDRDDSPGRYIPTQIIAELFKTNGFDGIRYKSLFNGGQNLALFDKGSADQVGESKVVQVTRIDLAFKQVHPFDFGDARGKSPGGPDASTTPPQGSASEKSP